MYEEDVESDEVYDDSVDTEEEDFDAREAGFTVGEEKARFNARARQRDL
jgi:hypothetical protein